MKDKFFFSLSRLGMKIGCFGSIYIPLWLFPMTAHANGSTEFILIFFGGIPLICPLLLGCILLWWKRKELVENRGMVTAIYIAGMCAVVGLSTIGISLLIDQVFPFDPAGSRPMWVEVIYFPMLFFIIPMGAAVLLARILYQKFREPLSTTEEPNCDEHP